MTAEIRQTGAKYYINGDLYAEATYQEADVPQKGYFGFAIYNAEDKTIKDVKVTELSDAATANVTAPVTSDNSFCSNQGSTCVCKAGNTVLFGKDNGGKLDESEPYASITALTDNTVCSA